MLWFALCLLSKANSFYVCEYSMDILIGYCQAEMNSGLKSEQTVQLSFKRERESNSSVGEGEYLLLHSNTPCTYEFQAVFFYQDCATRQRRQ